jgi:hypothetical protein
LEAAMLGIPISVIATVAAYFLFSAAVGAMSHPTADQENGFYGWLYRFLQRLAANADRLAEARNPALAALAHTGDASFVGHSTTTERTDIAVSR